MLFVQSTALQVVAALRRKIKEADGGKRGD